MSFSIVDQEIWLLYMCSSFTNTQILSQQTSLLKCYDFNYKEHVANTSTNTNMNVLCVKIQLEFQLWWWADNMATSAPGESLTSMCSQSCPLFPIEKCLTFERGLSSSKPKALILFTISMIILVAGRKSTKDSANHMSIFSFICLELGIPLAHEKTLGPTANLVFFGLKQNLRQYLLIPFHNHKLRVKKISS